MENLAGTFASILGSTEKAVTIFSAVANENHPAARYAHEQLSGLHRAMEDHEALSRHARDWILQALRTGGDIPSTAMEDLILYQAVTGRPAVGRELLATLVEQMERGDPAIPGLALLELLEGQWETYGPFLKAGKLDFNQWIEKRRDQFNRDGNWLPYSLCLLFEADKLEETGRHDSADTRRIRILQSVGKDILSETCLYPVAVTADKYDFPEAIVLWQTFLERFPGSPHRPVALFYLAQRLRREEKGHRAASLLAEVLTHWPDADVYPQACLLQAEWSLADADPVHTTDLLQVRLDRSGLLPRITAQALLLRARADFELGNKERGRLACRRILALYPAFDSIAGEANALLQAHHGGEENA